MDKQWYYVILISSINKSESHCYTVMAVNEEEATKQARQIMQVEDNRQELYPWDVLRVGSMEMTTI